MQWRGMKLLMTLAIAAAFTTAIVPRSWLHSCDQEHVDHHHPDHAALYGDLDCEVCSVIVAVFEDRAWKHEAAITASLSFQFLLQVPVPVERSREAPASRGPPLG